MFKIHQIIIRNTDFETSRRRKNSHALKRQRAREKELQWDGEETENDMVSVT